MSQAMEKTERLSVRDLKPKMQFDGQVTAIELYGAFVDIGAEKDGLVHISQISQQQVHRVADALNMGDQVTVWIRQIDADRGRINLTMIEPPELTMDELKPNQVVKGSVTKLVTYGAFVDIGVGRDGLIHISEMSDGFVGKPSEVMSAGDEIEVRVVKVDQSKRRIELSMLGLPGDESQEPEAQEDDGEESSLTAMELAWQDAMERQGTSISVPKHTKGRRRRKSDIRREQASIIARTLQSKRD